MNDNLAAFRTAMEALREEGMAATAEEAEAQVNALVREVQELRAKVKEQQEALDDAQQAAWEREEARD